MEFEKDRTKAKQIAVALTNISDVKFLGEFLKKLQSPKPLNASFETWSKSSGITGWEEDVKYFRKYNRTRNLLLHTGELGDVEDDPVKGEDVITIERIASRYISYFIYGEANPYDPILDIK